MIKKIIGLGFWLHLTILLVAQPATTSSRAFREKNLWLLGSNPAGLIFNPNQSFSVARGDYRYTTGELRQATDASTIHHYQLSSESFRILKKLPLYGRISYNSDYQQNRQWSALIRPEAHLFNFGDTIAGRQYCETYAICGQIAVPINQHWTIGGKLDYSARSNSKNTDPRNENNQTDLLVTPGVIFSRGKVHYGIHLLYQKISEKITYSTQDLQLRDGRTFYPLWFYTTEDLQNGTTNLRAYREGRYGVGLQFFILDSDWEWFNEFSYIQGIEKIDIYPIQNTKAGEIEYKHFHYIGSIRLNRQLQHTFIPQYLYVKRTGYDYLQGKLTTDNNEMAVEDYGRIKRSATLCHRIKLTYTLANPIDTLNNRWRLHTYWNYDENKTIFLLYPARFVQTIHQMTFATGYERRMKIGKNILESTLQLTYTYSWGTLPEMQSENNSPLPEIRLPQKQDLLQHNFRMSTTEKLSLNLQLQYTYPLKDKFAFFGMIKGCHYQGLSNPPISRTDCQIATGLIF